MTTDDHNPQREANRAILAHVKEEMNAPRMSESAREQEEESHPAHGAGAREAAIHRTKEHGRREDGSCQS
jgi:hypothetical protein